MRNIGLIRHGETEWNTKGLSQGHSDIPLNKAGIVQGAKVAYRVAQEPWDLIYSSQMKRATKTAEIITEKLAMPHFIDQRLRERHGGLIEGTTEEERIEKWGKNWQFLDLQLESDESVKNRGLAALEDMLVNHPDKNILIVSHTALIQQLVYALAPDQPKDVSLVNCSLTVFETDDKSWHLKVLNAHEHMK